MQVQEQETEDISAETMQETHDEQLRNMKERWNLLQNLRKEKRGQRTPGMTAMSPGDEAGKEGVLSNEQPQTARIYRRKKKAKSTVRQLPIGTPKNRPPAQMPTVAGSSVVKVDTTDDVDMNTAL
jgi:hypothetical protein